ncbi:MAG TPA: alpha/beta hydrolase [Mycobacteriales bacterium]|nr:alpha/beta hydrolase [Mycobacteriales bacterium]
MRIAPGLTLLFFLNLARWARRTRPEPLPAPPTGSTTVLTRDGTRLYAEIGGREDAAITMLFVHGYLARTITFDLQWQHFSDKVRMVRYDHRNHGRSEHSTKPIDVQTLARDLADVIDQTAAAGRVILVGHSMGGMTCLALAHDDPDLFTDRVAGVALLGSGAGHYIDGHRWENLFRLLGRRQILAPGLLLLRLLAPALEHVRPRRTHFMRGTVKRLAFGTADVDPAALAMTQEVLEGAPLSTLAALQGSILRHDMVHALDRLQGMPVLVLTGSDDRLTRPEHSRRTAADIGPGAEFAIVPGAGHVVNQTRPVETNAALDRLVDRVVGLATYPAA